MREKCGVFGIVGRPDAAKCAYLGLYALQHRGQESAGIAVSDGVQVRMHKGMGLVRAVFSDPATMEDLPGGMAVGHNRYSTTGVPDPINAQPIVIQYKRGQLAAAHNGNLVNAGSLRAALEEDGSIFQTTSDSEVILHLIARSRRGTLCEMLAEALGQVEGSYSLLLMSRDEMIGARDPHGFRPLSLGRLGEAWLLASESCAFDILGAQYARSVEPGEIVVLGRGAPVSHRLPAARRAQCIFEFIYFSRPDSLVFDEKVDKIRRRFGRELAREHPTDADIVIAVPDSANTAALGYAEESGLKFEIGLIRNHYVGRTFIQPHQHERDIDVRVKFNPVAGVLRARRVVLVEDSIVRGTTLRQLVRLVRGAGAREVHVRVSSPPIRHPCYYGIDMSRTDEFIAAAMSVEEICRHVGADSLAYLSVEGMLRCVADAAAFCTCCFTGAYPTPHPEAFGKEQFEPGERKR